MRLPENQLPTGDKRRVMPPGLGPVMDLLKVLLKQVCEEHGVASKLIATTDELEDIAADDSAEVPALTWLAARAVRQPGSCA